MRRKLSEVDPVDEKGRTYAEVLAEQAILKAKGGDIPALAHVANRTEGKPRQSVTLTVEQREKFESAVSRMMNETGCTRDGAISTLSIFKPEVSELLH